MNVAMCVSTIFFAVLICQTISAPIPEDDNAAQTPLQLHQEAIRLFRKYKYIDENAKFGDCELCTSCEPDCADVLAEMLRDYIIEVQTRYGDEPTGILTQKFVAELELPRCGDKDDFVSVHRTKRWDRLGKNTWNPETVLQISFRNYLPNFSKQEQENIALACATLWAEPTPLSFQLAAEGDLGHIDIQFKYIDGEYQTVGLGLSPTPWGTLGRDYSYLQLDNKEIWKLSNREDTPGISLKWAMCHEMGHNLGLAHSSDKTAIMYPAGIGQGEDRLSSDDYNGITSLYRGGGNGKTVFGRAPKRGSSSPPPSPSYPSSHRFQTPPPRHPSPPPRYPSPPPRPTPRTAPPPANYPSYRPDRNYAPAGHVPNYRPGSRPPPPPSNTWHYDPRLQRY